MAAPTKFVPSYDFSDYQAASPNDPLPGAQVDAQLALLKTTTDETIDNLALIQKDDGTLKNNSVGNDQLKSEVVIGLNAATDWLTATDYVVNDVVWNSDALYRCLVAHTSGTFSTDLAASKWSELLDLSEYAALGTLYLGAKASDPTVDNDGNALVAGALYYNTGSTVLKYYTGSAWVAIPSGADVTTVAGISADVTTVAGISANVTTVAGDSADITTVAGISSDVTTVAADGTDIGTVATNIANVNTVAGDSANVNTVAGISANVTTVAGISADVTTVATNVTDVTNFANVYVGPSASDPTQRADASALQAGDLYFNTTSDEMRVYDGAAWAAAYLPAASYVAGPGSSTDNALPRFDGTAGNVVQNSAILVDDNGTMSGARFKDTSTDVYAISGTSGAITVDHENGHIQTITVTGSVTFTFSNWPSSGQEGWVKLKVTNGSNFGSSDLDGTNWWLTDGTTSTTFSDTGITLGSYNELLIYTTDGGSTRYGYVS